MYERTPDGLAGIGRAAYGDQWQGPMARDLEINRETIRRWLNGHTPLSQEHAIWEAIIALFEAKSASYAALARAIEPARDAR